MWGHDFIMSVNDDVQLKLFTIPDILKICPYNLFINIHLGIIADNHIKLLYVYRYLF